MAQAEVVRAIYRDGVLQLLEPVDLPGGAEDWVDLQVAPPSKIETPLPPERVQQGPSYPTRPQPPETLEWLIGLVTAGGRRPCRLRGPLRCRLLLTP